MKQTAVLILVLLFTNIVAQDTFSIVAVDEETGEVGSAGASCVDLFNTPFADDSFLAELFPGVGAINTQAAYIVGNQIQARALMNAGLPADSILIFVTEADPSGTAANRQYGIAKLETTGPVAANYTGDQCISYANAITGPNYSIQGNILSGQAVLDSMEAQFLRAEGSLACRLMAALQGANVVGADTRCATNGTSSLFAFVKTAKSDDTFGNPSFKLSVRTRNGDNIEPIDSLQTLFDEGNHCTTSSTGSVDFHMRTLYPNPANDILHVSAPDQLLTSCEIHSADGVTYPCHISDNTVQLTTLPTGIYTLILTDGRDETLHKFVKL